MSNVLRPCPVES